MSRWLITCIFSLVTACSVLGQVDQSSYKGYRGFIDILGHVDFKNFVFCGEIATIHGYQGCPYLFLGGGLGHVIEYYSSEYEETLSTGQKQWSNLLYFRIPLYLDVRVDVPFQHGGPFFDLRMGLDIYSNEHIGFHNFYRDLNVYTCLTAGYRIQSSRKGGVNFYLGARFCEPIAIAVDSRVKQSHLDKWHTSLRFGIGFDF